MAIRSWEIFSQNSLAHRVTATRLAILAEVADNSLVQNADPKKQYQRSKQHHQQDATDTDFTGAVQTRRRLCEVPIFKSDPWSPGHNVIIVVTIFVRSVLLVEGVTLQV